MINRNILQLFPYAQKEAGCVIICTEFYFKANGTHKPFLALDLRHHCDFWMFSFLLRYLLFKSFLNNLYCWQELWIPMSGCILQGQGSSPLWALAGQTIQGAAFCSWFEQPGQKGKGLIAVLQPVCSFCLPITKYPVDLPSAAPWMQESRNTH